MINRPFWIGLLKTLFLAIPGTLLMIYLIYQLQIYLEQNFSFALPAWALYFLILSLGYLIGKVTIGKELAEMRAARKAK
jgi:uncharacterized membrane protein AbrB (regulator of aidB expression)